MLHFKCISGFRRSALLPQRLGLVLQLTLSCLGLIGLCGCPKPTLPPVVVSGNDAIRLLSPERRQSLQNLQAKSTSPVAITVDADSRAILTLKLSYPLANPNSPGFTDQMKTFLNKYQSLIDPNVGASEITLDSGAENCGSSAITYNRTVNDTTVLGSKLTLHFSADGNLVDLVNGIASVPNTLEVRPARPKPQAGKLLPANLDLSQAKRYDVLIPETSGRRGYLRSAKLVTWAGGLQNGVPSLGAAIEDTSGALLHSFKIGVPLPGYSQPGFPQPRYHNDPDTGIPDFIGYHDVGGVSVESLPEDHNPVELVYRFLGEHPSLFRTGAPRCQFGFKDMTQAASLPGVTFVRMQQLYLGFPVFGGELVFEVHDYNKIMAVSGHALPFYDRGPNWNPSPQQSPAQAVTAAKSALLGQLQGNASPEFIAAVTPVINQANPSPPLLVFPGRFSRRDTGDGLAYMVVLDEFIYFVDSYDGHIVYSIATREPSNIINDALATSEFNRANFVTVNVNGLPVAGAPPLNPDLPGTTGAVLSLNTGVAPFYARFGVTGIGSHGGDYVINTNVGLIFPGIPPFSICPNASLHHARSLLLWQWSRRCPGRRCTPRRYRTRTHTWRYRRHFKSGVRR